MHVPPYTTRFMSENKRKAQSGGGDRPAKKQAVTPNPRIKSIYVAGSAVARPVIGILS